MPIVLKKTRNSWVMIYNVLLYILRIAYSTSKETIHSNHSLPDLTIIFLMLYPLLKTVNFIF